MIRNIKLKEYTTFFFKGIGMGGANIIPGVSGGTIALITGIFERLINAIKSFDMQAIRLIMQGDLKGFLKHTDLFFLVAVFGGAGTGIFTLSFILDPLLMNAPEYVWAFFFGLIIASVVSVGKTVSSFSARTISAFIIGTAIAVFITVVFQQATPNPAIWYVFLCGIVATCSMILPGLSGSFVLILMGNYELIMIDAVKGLQLPILLPLFAGAGFGLIAFSHFLSWIFKRYRDSTIALLTGFIFGSLGILWPWKYELVQTLAGKDKVIGYNWYIPDTFSQEVGIALLLMVAGIVVITLIERAVTKI